MKGYSKILPALDLHQQGKHEEALKHLQDILRDLEKSDSKSNSALVPTLAWLGRVARTLGRFDQAESFFLRALAILDQKEMPDDKEIAGTLEPFALLLLDRNRLDEAQGLLERVRAAREKVFGVDHPEMAGVLSNLSIIALRQARFKEADELLRRAWALLASMVAQTPESGPAARLSLADHAKWLNVSSKMLTNTVSALLKQGRYGEAVPLAELVLKLEEALHGPGCPEVLPNLNNLAICHNNLGRFDEAEQLHNRLRSIREKWYGAAHPKTALALLNLGVVAEAQGWHRRAARLAEEAQAILTAAHGPDDANVANALNNRGEVLLGLGDRKDAEDLLRRSLALKEKLYGSEHPGAATGLYLLGTLRARQGDPAGGGALCNQAVVLTANKLGPGSAKLIKPLLALAEVRTLAGNNNEAEIIYLRAQSLIGTCFCSDHYLSALALAGLARLRSHQGRLEETEKLLHQALDIAEKTLPETHPTTTTLLDELAGLAETRGQKTESAHLRKRAAALRRRHTQLDQ